MRWSFIRCSHWNRRGYGRCLLEEGHDPVNNGAGVWYRHEYDRRFPAAGTYDVEEACDPPPPTREPCSACGRDESVEWHLVKVGATYFWRWRCVACFSFKHLEVTG